MHVAAVRVPCPDGDDVARQVPRKVQELAAVSQQEIALPVRLGIGRGYTAERAAHDQGLKRVGHGVAMAAVAVPALETHQGAHAGPDEVVRRLDPGVEAAHVSDLEHPAGPADGLPQRLGLLDRCRQRLGGP